MVDHMLLCINDSVVPEISSLSFLCLLALLPLASELRYTKKPLQQQGLQEYL
jgi:hypothetical protein